MPSEAGRDQNNVAPIIRPSTEPHPLRVLLYADQAFCLQEKERGGDLAYFNGRLDQIGRLLHMLP